jgi:hypothetical protein
MTSGVFNNQGLLAKVDSASSNHGVTAMGTTLNNTGTVEVATGTLYLGPVSQASNGVLSGGSWLVVNSTGAGASLVMSSTGGIATIAPGASVTLDGPGTSFSNLASLSAVEGAFYLLGGQSFGTLGSLSNFGVIYLGAGDALGVRGNYGQAPGATLDVTIAGPSYSNQVGHLYVSGDAYFGGTLNIVVPSGFIPVFNDRYVILSYRHVRLFFGAINAPTFPNGEYFSISYLGNGLYLRVR